MSLEILSLENSAQWDEIVKSFKLYDIYYLSGYVKAFQAHGDGEPLLIYYLDEDTRAINVVFKRVIQYKSDYFDFSTPYGYGGFLVEGSSIDRLNEEYSKYCVDNNIVCEFVRFHPLSKNYHMLDSMYDISRLGETVCIDLNSSTEIWSNIHSKNRNMIRKAIKSNLKVYWGTDNFLIKQFMSIYEETMKKDNASNYYYFEKNFYEIIFDRLRFNAIFFYTKLDDEIVSISIFLLCNQRMHYFLSASKKDYQALAPTNLLIHEASIWGLENGYNKLHLGGGLGFHKDNLYKFKKSFNRLADEDYFIGKKIFNDVMYQELEKIRTTDIGVLNNNYFPIYRA